VPRCAVLCCAVLCCAVLTAARPARSQRSAGAKTRIAKSSGEKRSVGGLKTISYGRYVSGSPSPDVLGAAVAGDTGDDDEGPLTVPPNAALSRKSWASRRAETVKPTSDGDDPTIVAAEASIRSACMGRQALGAAWNDLEWRARRSEPLFRRHR